MMSRNLAFLLKSYANPASWGPQKYAQKMRNIAWAMKYINFMQGSRGKYTSM